jgi:hypothetical protein
VILLFDNDDAGNNAARRVCSQVMSPTSEIDLQIASFVEAKAIHNSFHPTRSVLKDEISVKDASDLLSYIGDRAVVADVVARLMTQSVGWKEWFIDDIAQGYSIDSVLSESIPRPSDFSRYIE